MGLLNGVDVFHYDPGVADKVNCPTCGEEMLVQRNANGPTSYVAAISKSKRLHDFFYCSHAKEDWHLQARQLNELAKTTPSAKLAKMYRDEAAEIIETKECTKKPTGL